MISKNLIDKHSQQLLNHAKQFTDAFKNFSKRAIQKQQKEPVIPLVIKLLIKSRKSPKIHNKMILKELKKSIIRKYLRKEMDLRKKDKKLLMHLDWNDIIMKYQKITNVSKN